MATVLAPQEYAGDPAVVVDEARNARDVVRIRREIAGREWATRHGIGTAETVAVHPDGLWLVSRRARDEPGEPWSYVLAAFDAASRIQDLPCPDFAGSPTAWRAPRRSVPLRAARLLRAGVDLREFVAARTAFDQLPRSVTVHNDFHRKNVLNSGTDGRPGSGVTVIDWELTARGPRHHDLVMLIVDVVDSEVARAAWQLLLDSVPVQEHPALATQLRWLTLRTYTSEITSPSDDTDVAKTARRRERWRAAQQWADELVTDPREVS